MEKQRKTVGGIYLKSLQRVSMALIILFASLTHDDTQMSAGIGPNVDNVTTESHTRDTDSAYKEIRTIEDMKEMANRLLDMKKRNNALILQILDRLNEQVEANDSGIGAKELKNKLKELLNLQEQNDESITKFSRYLLTLTHMDRYAKDKVEIVNIVLMLLLADMNSKGLGGPSDF